MLPIKKITSRVYPIEGNSAPKRSSTHRAKRISYGVQWISNNFAKKECKRFVGRLSRPEICKCGRTLYQHDPSLLDTILDETEEINPPDDSSDQTPSNTEQEKADDDLTHQATINGTPSTMLVDNNTTLTATESAPSSRPWNRLEDIIEIPTDSFGTIDFLNGNQDKHLHGHTKPKYVRVSDTTKPQKILDLLHNYWDLSLPDIVISIAGGAKNYHMDGHLQENFTNKLVKALHGTSAWFITSGINQGIAQSVGKIVRQYQELSWAGIRKAGDGYLRSIGMCSWGYLEGRECLVNPNLKVQNPAKYEEPNLDGETNSSSLNSDHTHFILVDDGTVGKYGFELELRADLEKYIAMPKDDSNPEESGLGVPVVVLAVEGGINAILTVCQAVSRNIPAVVFEGSGRAADIIAYAHKHCIKTSDGRQLDPKYVPVIREMLRKTYSSQKADFDILLRKINLSVKKENLLTIYCMDEDTNLDFVISTALLKAESGSVFNQLKVALTWNNIAVAKNLIEKETHQLVCDGFSSLLTTALIENKLDFIQLFLENGLTMKNYLTVSRLKELYNTNDSKNNFFRRILRIETGLQMHDDFSLQYVDYLLKKLLKSHNEPMYLTEQLRTMNSNGHDLENSLVFFSNKLIGSTMDFEVSNDLIYQAKFDRPYQELFIWAILTDRIQIAECLWESVENPLASAIVASLLYRAMAGYFMHLESQKSYQNHALKFDQLSLRFLNVCYKKNEDLTENLIQRSYTKWGDKDIFTLGSRTKNKEFKFHPCCQNVLTKIWKNGMQHSSFTLFFALLMPVLISNLKFSSYALYQRLTIYQKIKAFYSAPIIKFYGFTITYIIFLLMFSYTILVDINQDKLGVFEWFVFVWISTLIIDEIKQALVPQDHETIKSRFSAWATSGWNILDAVTMILGILVFVMRFSAQTRDVCRSLYAINGALFYLRIIRLLSFSATLGPKLVMIRKMVKEMFYFLFILLIFLVAYGVAGSALWHPYRKHFHWAIIGDILYFPYFQTYGELFLTEIHQDNNCSSLTGMAQEDCTEYHPLLLVLLAIYLLIGNILLLNLLIAIFSYIFEEVQTNSFRVWKLEMYNLVSEFEERPVLPPPIMIFEIMVDYFNWMFYKTCCKNKTRGDSWGKRRKLTSKVIEVLDNFEKECSIIFNENNRKKTMKNGFSENITQPLDFASKEEFTRIEKEKRNPNKNRKSDVKTSSKHASLDIRDTTRKNPENILQIAVNGKRRLKRLKRNLAKNLSLKQDLLETNDHLFINSQDKSDLRLVQNETSNKSGTHSVFNAADANEHLQRLEEEFKNMSLRLQRIENLLEAVLNHSSQTKKKDTEPTIDSSEI